ncbi:MAG: carboxylating nicotinate-nucleotide diphosphorylase [Acidimicrobiales bacterium]|nr:carboxylating nicotinate-nucleotide diphosphorylase [Acidimicrobiales bacterium]
MSRTDLHPPIGAVREAVGRAIAEDLTPLGDLTSGLLPATARATAEFVARTDGVLAGRLCADEAFRQIDPWVTATWAADDGDAVHAGQVLGRVDGPLASVLTGERTALNFLSHLSGVATLTRRYVDAVAAAGGGAQVWDTRKTTPGLRSLEKAAVRAGGGRNHRGNLSDWVMLKDNHLTVLGITDAVATAKDRWPARTIHVECASLEEVIEALGAGADALLLDNMSPDEVRAAMAAVGEHRAGGGAPCLVEASGGINLDTIAAYAVTGVDLISVGAITNSAPVLDIGLDIAVDQTPSPAPEGPSPSTPPPAADPAASPSDDDAGAP